MKKIIEFASVSDKEARLEEISGYLEQLKTSLAELVEDYESENEEEEKVTVLTDAYDAVEEVLLDGTP